VASHSGGRKTTSNAIEKAAQLVRALSTADVPQDTTADFPLPPKLTVTTIHGGQSYSITPDLCTLTIDIRTTPTFDNDDARQLLELRTAHIDQAWPDTQATRIETDNTWSAYALPTDSPLRTAILDAAKSAGLSLEPKVAGPSNIGNYLAGLGIPATAGFGVGYQGLHATNERIRLTTIPLVHTVYRTALGHLLRT
jgi:succinyl-diaminopimelate desuccinylase